MNPLRVVNEALELVEASRSPGAAAWLPKLSEVRPTSDHVFILAKLVGNLLQAKAEDVGITFDDAVRQVLTQALEDAPTDPTTGRVLED